MTVTTQAPAPPRRRTVPAGSGRLRTVPDAQAAIPVPPVPAPRRRQIALTPMRQETAKRIRKLAASVQESHPDMTVHDHLRDAARTLESGNEEASQRHLRAAMFALTPQSLMRNGLHTDDHHQAARQVMHGVHRHLLLVKDITDAAAKNQAAIRRDSYGDDSTSPPMPQPPVHADPNAGYGPGALAQKPTARQPGGDRALNAPNRAGTGKPDPNVADPVGPQPRGSKQFSYDWGDLAAVIELAVTRPKVVDLVGPRGFIHDWVFIGVPGQGDEVYHPGHGRGTVTAAGKGRVHVSFDSGHSASFPVRSKQGPGHFEQMTDDELAAEYNRSEGSRASAIVGELDKRDQRDEDAAAQAKAQRVKSLYAEQPKTEADRSRVYQSLVNEGENPEEAWAHAHSTNPEAMQKQTVIQQLRTQGYKGGGFDALTRAAYKDEVRRRVVTAEGATNGYMLSPRGKQAGVDPWSLFTGPESRARKYASPELKEWWDQNGRPTAADFQAQLMGAKQGARPSDFYASVTWDELASVIELSAKTAALEVTPAPYGKPGGPGLYGVAGNKHSDYMEQVVQALRRRGMDKGKASAIARGSLEKWAAGGGHVSPEVKAAAQKALAQEAAASAKAHGHANSWDEVAARVLDLAAPPPPPSAPPPYNPAQPRVAAGQATAGQFAPAGSGGGQQQQAQGKGGAPAKGKAPAKAAAKPGALKAAAGGKAQQKQNLLQKAAGFRAQADALIKQRDALRAALASASGKTSSGQAGAKTATTAKTKTTAPAAKAGTTAAPAASTAAKAPAKTTAATAAKAAKAPAAGSAAAVKAQITALNTQIVGLQQQYAVAMAQAAKL